MNNSSYKKYTAVLLIITALALTVTAAAVTMKKKDPPATQAYASYYSPNTAASQETEEKPETSCALQGAGRQEDAQSRGTYLITVYEGKIAAFVLGDDVPFLVGDLPVDLLPEADRKILQEGIIVDKLADLKTVLEDYE